MDFIGDITLNERQKLVYSYLKKFNISMSHGEISKGLKIPFNQVSPRINELRKMKLIMKGKPRKCVVTDRVVKTWRINYNRKRDSFDMTDLL